MLSFAFPFASSGESGDLTGRRIDCRWLGLGEQGRDRVPCRARQFLAQLRAGSALGFPGEEPVPQ
jgi:hypothetical protein